MSIGIAALGSMAGALGGRSREETLDLLLDDLARHHVTGAGIGHDPRELVAALKWRQGLHKTRFLRNAVIHQPYPGLEVISLRQRRAIRHAEFIGEKRGILRSHSKGDERAGVAKHGMPQALRQLADVLVRRHQ